MVHLGYVSTRPSAAFSTHTDRDLDAFFIKNSVHGMYKDWYCFLMISSMDTYDNEDDDIYISHAEHTWVHNLTISTVHLSIDVMQYP